MHTCLLQYAFGVRFRAVLQEGYTDNRSVNSVVTERCHPQKLVLTWGDIFSEENQIGLHFLSKSVVW